MIPRLFIFVILSLYFIHVTESEQKTFNFNLEEEILNRIKRQSSSSRLWGQSTLWNDLGVPQFWKDYKNGPFGIVIRGWQFSRCASEQWTKYKANVTNLVIWPRYPRFPGPIFFNVTADIKEELPTDRIELELEIREAVTSKGSEERGWQVIPCQGWNILDGCDGVGSCRYCDVLEKCQKTVRAGYKHTDDEDLKGKLRKAQLCPPPKGTWTINFSQVYKVEDIPNGMFGPLQSNEYWLTMTFTDGRGTPIACARIWMDICKYHLYDRYQQCLRDPDAFKNFLDKLTEHVQTTRE